MGDNTDNQLGISQRGKSEDPVLRLNTPTRIHLSAHTRAAKPVQVSCGASHTAAVTGQLYAMPPGGIENMYHLNLDPVQTLPEKTENDVFTLKTHQMFSVRTTAENFKSSTMTSSRNACTKCTQVEGRG